MSSSNSTQPQRKTMTPEDRWLECIALWYPKRLRQTYFLPPYHFRKINYDVGKIEDFPYDVLQPVPLPVSGATASAPLLAPTPLPQPSLPVAPVPNVNGATVVPPLHAPTSLPQPSLPMAPLPNASGATAGPPLLPHTPLTVSGSVFTVPQGAAPVYQGSDCVDDKAMERLVDCLHALSEDHAEPMLVISQLEFRKYLDGCTDPIEVAFRNTLPRPINAPPPQVSDGDLDVLVIHRLYGLLVLEVKAVGAHRDPTFSLQQAVQKRVKKAANQLNKAECMLRHLLSNQNELRGVRITTSIVLPHISSAELKDAVGNDKKLEQHLCTVLGAPDLNAAVDRCLCMDKLPPITQTSRGQSQPSQTSSGHSQPRQITGGIILPSQPSSGVIQPSQPSHSAGSFVRAIRRWRRRNNAQRPLRSWWQQMTCQSSGPDLVMTESVSDTLLARFCGPATSVEVPTMTAPGKAVKTIRTEGEGIAETGLILSLLALYPEQVKLLSDNSIRFLYLNGPPGTGKTVMLVVKAIQMLHKGYHVLVLSILDESRPVSLLIERQLRHALGPNPLPTLGTITRSDFCDINDAQGKEFKGKGKLLIIADESLDSMDFYGNKMPADVKSFLEMVKLQVPDLAVWCASVQVCGDLPQWMAERTLTVALRTTPVVTAEVQRSFEGFGTVPKYSPQLTSAATAGPAVRRWPQRKQWEGGRARNVGDSIVELLEELGVGKSPDPDALHYRDILILADWQTTRAFEGISSALEAGDVPWQALGSRSLSYLPSKSSGCSHEDVALARTNKVTLTIAELIPGLERRVVIVLAGGNTTDLYDWLAPSRCTGLLVIVGPRE